MPGYTDYFYFTRVFRKLTGITPTEWREKHRIRRKNEGEAEDKLLKT